MKYPLLPLFFLFIFNPSYSQTTYLSINSGISTGFLKETLGMSSQITETDSPEPVSINTAIRGTFGNGIPVNVSCGYMFTKSFGFEIGAGYFFGFETTQNETYYDWGYTENQSSTVNYFRLFPSIVLQPETKKKMTPFIKSGMVIAFGKIGTTTGIFKSSTTETIIKTETTAKLSAGFTSSLGLNYEINDCFSFFGEIQMIGLRIHADKLKRIQMESNGVDLLASDPSLAVEYDYVNEINSNYYDPTQETQLKIIGNTANFSSIGLNIGLKINL